LFKVFYLLLKCLFLGLKGFNHLGIQFIHLLVLEGKDVDVLGKLVDVIVGFGEAFTAGAESDL